MQKFSAIAPPTLAHASSLEDGAPSNSDGENLLAVHEELLSKHNGQESPPRQGPASDPQFANASGDSGAPQISSALVRQGVRSILGAVDGVLCRKIYRAALSLSADDGLAKNFAVDAGLTKDEADLASDLCAVLCEKYQIAGQYAPEALLALAGIGYVTRIVLTFKKLEDLARIKSKTDNRPAADTAAPAPAPA